MGIPEGPASGPGWSGGTRPRAWRSALAGLVVGLAVGAGLGRVSAPEPPSGSAPPDLRRDESLADSLAASLAGERLAAGRLAARVQDLESAIAEIDEDGGPELISRAIGALSDAELRSVLASAVQLDDDELAEIRDVRAFSTRLAEIAMADIVTPAAATAGSSRVVFAAGPDPEVAGAATRFPADTKRIYAVFPTADPRHDSVMVKWYRRDDPEILLFQRYPIVSGEDRGYVWLNPDSDWEAGQYEVGVYSGDESVQLLASGRYSVE